MTTKTENLRAANLLERIASDASFASELLRNGAANPRNAAYLVEAAALLKETHQRIEMAIEAAQEGAKLSPVIGTSIPGNNLFRYAAGDHGMTLVPAN
jgi:hypothetical protein